MFSFSFIISSGESLVCKNDFIISDSRWRPVCNLMNVCKNPSGDMLSKMPQVGGWGLSNNRFEDHTTRFGKFFLCQNTCILATFTCVWYCIHTLSFCVLQVSMDVRIFHSDPVEGNAQLPSDQALAWAVRQQEYCYQNGQRRRWSSLQQELCPPETRARLAKSLEGEKHVYSAPVISLMWSSSNLNIFVSGCSTEGEAVLVGDWHVSL